MISKGHNLLKSFDIHTFFNKKAQDLKHLSSNYKNSLLDRQFRVETFDR